MDKVFLTILNMSLTGAFVIGAICLARLPLKKAPKIVSYCLWAVAGFRLIFPFTIESIFSLIPWGAQPIPQTGLLNENVSFSSAASAAYHAISDAANGGLGTVTVYLGRTADGYAITTEAFHSQVWLLFLPYVWIIGAVVMLIYGIISYVLLKRKMRMAIRYEGGIYESDTVQTPFVLGILKPKIYIPPGLSELEREYIILHERTHIRRLDHVIKFAAYFILCLHWFNPMAWVAFLLMGVDMEMSCDERVLKEMGMETKKAYSMSLLSLAANRRVIGGSPLAFCEGGLKQRIKNVLNFKRPSQKIITLAVIFATVLSVGFAVNRAAKIELPVADDVSSVTMNRYEEYSPMGAVIVTDKEEINQILNALSGAAKTHQKSINDNPVSDNYLVLHLHLENEMRTLYLYTEDKDYIEEPYVAIYRPNDGFNFAYSMYNAYLAEQNITVDTISIIIWKDNNRQIRYSLFDGDITLSPPELAEGRMYDDVPGLNAALMEYPKDTISLIHVKHTEDFTKEEILGISEQFSIPSDIYSMAAGLYESGIATPGEEQDITTDTVQADYNEIQRIVSGGNEIWRLDPVEVASRYALEILNFQGTGTLYRNDGSEYARVTFLKQDGGEISIVLFQPVKKAEGGIWAVEYWFDENSRMHQVRDLTALPPLFYNDNNVPINVREAVRNAIVDDWTETFSKHYQVLGFYANNVSYMETGNSAELKFMLTLVTQNFYKDPDTVGYIKEAKEKGSDHYQQLYEEYNMPKSGSIDMKATMSLASNGVVLPDSIQIYSNISPHGEEYAPTKAEYFIISE